MVRRQPSQPGQLRKRVKALREARGWVQERLADEAGLSVKSVQRVEKGKRVRGHTILQIASVFDVDPAALCATDSIDVDALRNGYVAIAASQLRSHVPLNLVGGGDLDAALAEVVSSRGVAMVLGPSGCGKSQAALRAGLSDKKALPLWRRARYFHGLFDEWLRDATSPELSAAVIADRADVLLIADGINECPPVHRSALLDALVMLRARNNQLALIITATEVSEAREAIRGRPLHVARPDAATCAALALTHQVTTAQQSALGGALRWPVDFQMAGAAQGSLPQAATTFAIRKAYVAAQAIDQALASEEALMFGQFARLLADDVASSISDLRLEQLSHACGAPSPAQLQRSRLLEQHAGRWSFAHESIQHFALAEQALRTHLRTQGSIAQLATTLTDPRYTDARPLALEALDSPSDIRAFLTASQSTSLIAAALAGDHGPRVMHVAFAEAEQLLAVHASETSLRWAKSLGMAAGQAGTLMLCDKVLTVLDGSQQNALCVALLDGVRQMSNSYPAMAERNLLSILTCALPLQATRWTLRCLVTTHWLRAHRSLGILNADESCAVTDVILGALSCGSERALCPALDVAIEAKAHLNESARAQVAAALEAVDSPRDVWASTWLVEALDAYDCIESFVDEASLEADVHAVVLDPSNEENQHRAAYIFCTQFELVDALSMPHFDAISRLRGAERIAFLSAALMGMPLGGLSGDTCLRELLDCGEWKSNPYAQHAIRTASRRVPGESGCVQVDAIIFLSANVISIDNPVDTAENEGRRACAWRTLGHLAWLLATTASNVPTLWRDLERLLPESLSPVLVTLSAIELEHRKSALIPRIDRLCTESLVQFLRAALAHRATVAAYDIEEVIGRLAQFGSERERVLLIPFVEDARLGSAAVSALQQLNSRLRG